MDIVELVKGMSLLELVINNLKDAKVRNALKDVVPKLTRMLDHYDDDRRESSTEVSAAKRGLPASRPQGDADAKKPRPETVRRLRPTDPAPAQRSAEGRVPGGEAAMQEAVQRLCRPSLSPWRMTRRVRITWMTRLPIERMSRRWNATAICNSATHRAAHARLTRRMQGLDPAKFPHMTRLSGLAVGRTELSLLFS